MPELLLITPPFTQLNTPYPATAYLKGFLNTKGISAFQMDLGLEVILELFSRQGLLDLFYFVDAENGGIEEIESDNALRIFSMQADYIHTIDAVVTFLQGNNLSLARQICSRNFLPEASRFEQLDELDWAFGSMGIQDKAKHLATLYMEDLSDFIVECVDPNFGFSRYAERLGRSANSFDELYEKLQPIFVIPYVDVLYRRILDKRINEKKPKLVCFSVPFPGNLYSAFRCAAHIKHFYPHIKTAMGGGFPNTELRSLTDVRVFEFFDYITLDDGELPIELLVSNILNPSPQNPDFNFYKRTFLLEKGQVLYNDFSLRKDYKQADVGTPDYSDLLLDKYISVIEIANPMHSLWSDGRWNKLTMAHGCYWGKCTFCDISLDYIKVYEPITAKLLVDRMEQLIAQTGENGFHFVDEAAPPALMRAVAIEILRRKLIVTWWTNIRFEKSFTYDLCRLLAVSGCIAVSGGLEVASDRLLNLIKKGVTVEQVAQVTGSFTEAGIMVHAYLMYGYPTQTVQETVDSLEMVRQLFEVGVLQSGFWHQFALTAHSPVGLNPSDYGILPQYEEISFANNDIQFEDSTGIDHTQFSFGLKKSLFNYMHGIGFDMPLQGWFDFRIPKTQIRSNFIEKSLTPPVDILPKTSAKLIWIGKEFNIQLMDDNSNEYHITYHNNKTSIYFTMNDVLATWLIDRLSCCKPESGTIQTVGDFKLAYLKEYDDFALFWYSDAMTKLRSLGLLVV